MDNIREKMVQYYKENGYPMDGCFDKIDDKFVMNLFYAAEEYISKGNNIGNKKLQKIIMEKLSAKRDIFTERLEYVKSHMDFDGNDYFPEELGRTKISIWVLHNKENKELSTIINTRSKNQIAFEKSNFKDKCTYLIKSGLDYRDIASNYNMSSYNHKHAYNEPKVKPEIIAFPKEIEGSSYTKIYAFLLHFLENEDKIPDGCSSVWKKALKAIKYRKLNPKMASQKQKEERKVKDIYPEFKINLDACLKYAKRNNTLPPAEMKKLYNFWRSIRYTKKTPAKYLPYRDEADALLSPYYKFTCS